MYVTLCLVDLLVTMTKHLQVEHNVGLILNNFPDSSDNVGSSFCEIKIITFVDC